MQLWYFSNVTGFVTLVMWKMVSMEQITWLSLWVNYKKIWFSRGRILLRDFSLKWHQIVNMGKLRNIYFLDIKTENLLLTWGREMREWRRAFLGNFSNIGPRPIKFCSYASQQKTSKPGTFSMSTTHPVCVPANELLAT